MKENHFIIKEKKITRKCASLLWNRKFYRIINNRDLKEVLLRTVFYMKNEDLDVVKNLLHVCNYVRKFFILTKMFFHL